MDVDQFFQWELKVEANKEQNFKILEAFEKWLLEDQEIQKECESHLINAHVFINTFLITDDVVPIEEGFKLVGLYFGDYFIQNAPIANSETLLQNLKSIELLYTYLNAVTLVSDQDHAELTNTITMGKQSWLERCDIYHSGCEF